MMPLEYGQALYATMTLVYAVAEELRFIAGRDQPLLRYLYRYTDPIVSTEYWATFGPPETVNTAGIGQSIEVHLATSERFLVALRAALNEYQ